MADKWLTEFKAKRLAAEHDLVSVGMARVAVKNGCKYFVKVPRENADAARGQIEAWNPCLLNVGAKGINFYADGKIFLADRELYTVIKTLYS